MRRQWTPSETYELVRRYPAEGAAGLAVALERSVDSICSQARRYRIKSNSRRRRQGWSKASQIETVNARFFDETNPTVAYVLGFIWACGSLKTRHRSVLRLSCESHREETLQYVLSLMTSQHQTQKHGQRLVVEVCNSHLVRTLVQRFGKPSRDDAPGCPLPVITSSLIPPFAQGHLDATGFRGSSTIRWTGREKDMGELRQCITDSVEIENPKITRRSRTVHIAWTGSRNVQRICGWLGTSEHFQAIRKSP